MLEHPEAISIHALREESDVLYNGETIRVEVFQSTPSARRATSGSRPRPPWRCNFNPRPPRGGRHIDAVQSPHKKGFQSTPSARRATACSCQNSSCSLNFNPRPPRGGRRGQCIGCRIRKRISIHALREEGDSQSSTTRPANTDFNPRPPRGGRHSYQQGLPRMWTNFNPRPPRGGRRSTTSTSGAFTIFQSTPSARRATGRPQRPRCYPCISIHALREEGDGPKPFHRGWQQYFNPRPPRGGRRKKDNIKTPGDFISIHALREEGDFVLLLAFWAWLYFNPRPPRGGRQQKRRKNPPRLFHYTHLCTI